MEDWFTGSKLPLGKWVKVLVDYLQDHAAGFFDLVTATIAFFVNGLTPISFI